jgi:hypothetical protein
MRNIRVIKYLKALYSMSLFKNLLDNIFLAYNINKFIAFKGFI